MGDCFKCWKNVGKEVLFTSDCVCVYILSAGDHKLRVGYYAVLTDMVH